MNTSPANHRPLPGDPTKLLPCATRPGGEVDPFPSSTSRNLKQLELDPSLLQLLIDGEIDVTEGSSFGSYRILKKLGNGGFGDVWLAEQQAPLRRKVALKLIRANMVSRQAISHFKRERQAMAMMEHENIAKVYDANCIGGEPYFAMEYVPGLPITSYVRIKNLTLRQRIELFIPVCRAVQHVHQKLMLHRDLKPSNIIVIDRDGVAVPKLIDFGIAMPLTEGHCLAQADTSDMPATLPGYCIGTPQYMSPEQAMGIPDIDATSDIYSLGILLYELLVGEPPITDREMDGLAPHQQLDRVIEHETELPSTIWLSATTASNTRRYDKTLGENPKRISRELRGDLDWIVRKALNKDRFLRYASAEILAGDLVAYLRDEPISAGPSSFWYRLCKTYRRHKSITQVTALAMFVMFSCLGFAIDQYLHSETLPVREQLAVETGTPALASNFRSQTGQREKGMGEKASPGKPRNQ